MTTMSDRVSIKVLEADAKLIRQFQKSRGIEDDNEATDAFFGIARSRLKALANYADKTKSSKPKREKKAKAPKKAKAAAKPKAKAKAKGGAKKNGLSKPSAFKKAAEANGAAASA